MAPQLPEGAVMYEVYPRSFSDSGDDGIGDLLGATQRLDYLRWLGVNLLWLTPFYPSPLADGGYDVANYVGVDPLFGTLADFDMLVAEATMRSMGIVVDGVFNHTSDQHQWFVDSRSSRNSPRRGWYTWRNPAPDGGPPNNWISVFGGSAWTYDETTDQYYLHSFLPQQPDLNWESPEVRQALQSVLRFWFGRGVMGVRVDAWDWTGKDLQTFADDPVNPDYDPAIDHDPYHRLLHTNSTRLPRLADYLRALEEVAQEFSGRFIVTETYPAGRAELGSEYRAIFDQYTLGLSTPFVFGLMWSEFNALEVGRFVNRVQTVLRVGEVPMYVMGNHDSSRLASRVGEPAARAAAMLLLTLPGLPVIYAGDELGLVDGVILPHQVRDPAAKQHAKLGRDPGRTPIPWTVRRPKAGFTTGTPWLPITQPSAMSVEAQLGNPRSTLQLYRQLIAIRHTESSLERGEYGPISVSHPDVFVYVRRHRDEQVAVLLNLSGYDVRFSTLLDGGKRLLSSELDMPASDISLRSARLRPWEGWVVRLG